MTFRNPMNKLKGLKKHLQTVHLRLPIALSVAARIKMFLITVSWLVLLKTTTITLKTLKVQNNLS